MKKEYEIKKIAVTPGYYTQTEWQDEVLDDNFKIIQERKILKQSEFIQTGDPKIKYCVFYYGGEFNGLKEFHSEDGINGEVRPGYILKE